jgi:hypothetical protein
MTVIAGIVGAALLFGLFTLTRPRDKAGSAGCDGHCAGCTRDGACRENVGEPRR